MSSLPVICVFGLKNIKLQTSECPDFETRDMDLRCYLTDKKLYEILAKDRPSSIVSFGKASDFPVLSMAPFHVRKMWVHYDNVHDLGEKGQQVFNCFINNALFDRPGFPLVSVFTPAYKTGDKIEKPFRSLLAQTYPDWEWVVVDDSDDDGATFKRLSGIAEQDSRIRVYKESRPSGRIGTVKRTACGVARGKFLVELDHDDELTPNALRWIVEAFEANPEAGFVYTDFTECFEDGGPFTYVPGWGFGYGSYRQEVHGGIKYMVCNAPNINAKTIRHIVAAPNHTRVWRKSFYDEVGGHRDLLHVADDYELMIRTFLKTRMVRVSRLCYIQYRNIDGSGNTHQARNKEIQRLVRYISMRYDEAIHQRLLELNVDDFVWKPGEPSFFRLLVVPNPSPESHCTVLYDPKT